MGNDVLCRIRGPAPAESVAGAVRLALAGHGFVVAAQFDVQQELLEHVGAHLAPYVVLFAFNPAATHRVARCRPAAVATRIFPVVIRYSDDGMIVEVPDVPGSADPMMTDVLSGPRHRLSKALNELSVGA